MRSRAPIPIAAGAPIELRVEVDYERLRFAYRVGRRSDWHWLPQLFDASILSDEATAPGAAELHRRLRRHGLPGHGRAPRMPADFDWFEYRERDYVPDSISQSRRRRQAAADRRFPPTGAFENCAK